MTPHAQRSIWCSKSRVTTHRRGSRRVNEVSLRQALIPPRLLSRANASTQVLSKGAGPLGALLAGAVGQGIGSRWTLLIGVLGIMLSALWIFRAPLPVARSQ